MARIKVLPRNASFAWSPRSLGTNSNYIAAATSAQQMDASFSSSAQLEICSLLDSQESLDLRATYKMEIKHRVYSLLWASVAEESGLLVGGADNGVISVYDVGKIMSNDYGNAVVASTNVHSGHVTALGQSPLQTHLIASGANASEVYLWDLNKPSKPMAIGPKQQPHEQMVSIDWNHKVPHILGSLTQSRAYVWDLRKQDGPIMTLGDVGSRARWRCMQWHPDQPTSMCIASEDDAFACVQQWDVRFATTPVLQMDGHQKGIMAMSWCPADPELLLTCGKDQKLYLWNPQTGSYLTEIPNTSRNWPNEAHWSTANPNWLAVGSFDSRITVYSLCGGGVEGDVKGGQSPLQSPKLAESFGMSGADFQSHQQRRMSVSSQPSVQDTTQPIRLPHPPRWQRPGPCGARFTFGGKLISFGKSSDEDQLTAAGQPVHRTVRVKSVVVDTTLNAEAVNLHTALRSNTVGDYCREKENQTGLPPSDRLWWSFMRVCAEGSSRSAYHELLRVGEESVDALAERLNSVLGEDKSTWQLGPGCDEEEGEGAGSETTSDEGAIDNDVTVTRDMINLGESTTSARMTLPLSNIRQPLSVPTSASDPKSLLVAAVASARLPEAVELCVRDANWTDALLLANCAGDQLYERTAMCKSGATVSRYVALLASGRWNDFIHAVDVDQWRSTLTAVLSYAPGERLSSLCARLSTRMADAPNVETRKHAAIPCVIAGNVDAFVSACTADEPIQEFIARACVLRQVAKLYSARTSDAAPTAFVDKLCTHVGRLSNAGNVSEALALMRLVDQAEMKQESALILLDRLSGACGESLANKTRPFAVIAVGVVAQPQSGGRQPQAYGGQRPYAQQPRGGGGGGVPPAVQTYGGGMYQQPQQSQPTAANPMMGYGGQQQQPMMQQPMGQQPPPVLAPPPMGAMAPPGGLPRPQFHPPSINQHQQPNPTPPPSAGLMRPGETVQSYNTANSFMPQVPDMGAVRGAPPVATVAPNTAATPSESIYRQVKQSWNDPPASIPNKKSATPTAQVEQPAPITMPVLGGQPVIMNAMGRPPGAMGSAFAPPPQQVQGQQQQPQMAAEPEVVRQPIPDNLRPISDALDALIAKCRTSAATAPHLTKKVHECELKITSYLYDSLRAGSLSTDTCAHLQYMAQFANNADYANALGWHTHIVQNAGVEFTTVSHFMPALKLLISAAQQMHVQ